jgi:hypothetical protein
MHAQRHERAVRSARLGGVLFVPERESEAVAERFAGERGRLRNGSGQDQDARLVREVAVRPDKADELTQGV